MSNGSTKCCDEAKPDRSSPAFQFLDQMLALEKLPSYNQAPDRLTATLGRLKFMAEHYEEIQGWSAATPEPQPEKNGHPAIADVVAAEMISEYGSQGRSVAEDVMARKEFGLKKYGTPLQPFNGRDANIDLYQELVDGLKYARVCLYESQYNGRSNSPYFEIYEDLQRLCLAVKKLRKDLNSGQANRAGG